MYKIKLYIPEGSGNIPSYVLYGSAFLELNKQFIFRNDESGPTSITETDKKAMKQRLIAFDSLLDSSEAIITDKLDQECNRLVSSDQIFCWP